MSVDPATQQLQQMQLMHSQVQALTTELQRMQQQQAAYQAGAAHAAAAAAAAPAPAGPRRAKIPAASNFAGTASQLDSWLREMKQQFDWYQYTADAEQAAMAAAQLRGVALDWWSALTAVEQSALRLTFTAFETALRGRFQPVNSAQTARLALDSLRQGVRQSAADYISSFRRLLVSVPDMCEADKVHRFVQGLRGPIQQHLIVQGVDTLDKAIAMAARVGSLGLFAAASGAAAAAASAGGDAMDLNALASDGAGIEGLERENDGSDAPSDAPVTRAELHKMQKLLLAAMQHQRGGPSKRAPFGRGDRGPLRVPGLSAQQVRERLDGGLCFVCGEAGHRKFDCPQNKSKNQSGN